jgi:hypothetical protein
MPPAAEVPYQSASPGHAEVRVEESPVSVTAIMHSRPAAGLAHAVTTKAVLYAGRACLDIEVTLHDKPADDWPEAGWICLPVNAMKPLFRMGRLGGIADPARDFVSGSNHHLQAVHTGLTIADARGRGMGICPLDSPLVSLDRPGIFKYSPDFTPGKPIAFVNLFNNQWTTNFRFWNEGTITSRIRLWAFDPFEAASSLVTPSLEARYPFLAAVADGPAGKLPVMQKGLELSIPGTLVTAFGPNPTGSGTLLRLWEYAGRSGPCEVRLPAGTAASQIFPVNLRGESAGKPVPVKNGAFTTSLKGFAPASFVIP